MGESAVAATPAVRERPILFSAPMVRAILAGRKTQTRRVLRRVADGILDGRRAACPYGAPGDYLWVREAHRFPKCLDSMSATEIAAAALDADYQRPWAPIKYEADGHVANGDTLHSFTGPDFAPAEWGKLRPGMFLPRWASRLAPRVEAVRLEPLHAITEADAAAEGFAPSWESASPGEFVDDARSASDMFRDGWDRLNGKRPGAAWADNPVVWVVTFARVAAGGGAP